MRPPKLSLAQRDALRHMRADGASPQLLGLAGGLSAARASDAARIFHVAAPRGLRAPVPISPFPPGGHLPAAAAPPLAGGRRLSCRQGNEIAANHLTGIADAADTVTWQNTGILPLDAGDETC